MEWLTPKCRRDDKQEPHSSSHLSATFRCGAWCSRLRLIHVTCACMRKRRREDWRWKPTKSATAPAMLFPMGPSLRLQRSTETDEVRLTLESRKGSLGPIYLPCKMHG